MVGLLPAESVTVPLGVGLPLVPLTVTVTVRDCAVVIVAPFGDIVTVGVVLAVIVTCFLACSNPIPPEQPVHSVVSQICAPYKYVPAGGVS
jgi:hypothetical protein